LTAQVEHAAAEKTPVDGRSTLEMVLEKLGEVGEDAKLAVTEAREAKGHSIATYDLQLTLNERFNKLERRVVVVEVTRAWPAVIALAALVIATLALLRTLR
jgi:hypothetical protein